MLLTGNLYQQQPMNTGKKSEKKMVPSMPKLHGEGGFILE
jgi:hypothetical protein